MRATAGRGEVWATPVELRTKNEELRTERRTKNEEWNKELSVRTKKEERDAGTRNEERSLAPREAVADDPLVSSKGNARLVYSTNTAGKCPTCGWPQRSCKCSTRQSGKEPVPARIVAKLRMEKKGRGGKTVTVVYGLPENDAFLKDLSQQLKRACGTGGTVVEGGVELQGELRERVREVLMQLGYAVKG